MKQPIYKPKWIRGGVRGRAWYLGLTSKYHRLHGPAIEWSDGYKSWYSKGQRHREDGPAVEWSNGHKAWYVNGKFTMYERPGFERRLAGDDEG